MIALKFSSWTALTSIALISFALLGCGGTANTSSVPKGVALQDFNTPPVAQEDAGIPAGPTLNTEAYDYLPENQFLDTLSQPESTFSIDVDTASYAIVRRMILQGQKPPSGAVRIEELINYFTYDYPEPDGEHPFSVHTELANCPWQQTHQLLRVGLKGLSVEQGARAPSNLVFLLDVSGSMQQSNKLPLVKSAMKMLTAEMKKVDRIAIVVYAGASGLALNSTSLAEAPKILAAIEQLQAGGSTNGAAGIQLAYNIAEENFVPGGNNRVILCTDGDFNVGLTNQSQLVELIEEKAKSQVFLTVLGFGDGNYKDSTMEKLADKGNGNYAYIDSLLEARKVLVEQIGATLVTIAKDVKIQIDFNPQHVQAYRLLGYENRKLENRDFRDDAKDAGEIGAGHTVTAFYEIVPTGSKSVTDGNRPSEFVKPVVNESADPLTMLTVNLRYKLPQDTRSREFQVRVQAENYAARSPSMDFQFATAVVAYGMLLRESKLAGTANWDWVVATAEKNSGTDRSGLRSEFIQLAKSARQLSQIK